VMRSAKIEVDREVRARLVREQTLEVVRQAGGAARLNEAVLQEVVQLVERPTAFLCSFAEEFLALPSEVIVSVLEKHARCFAVFDAAGRILPKFVGVKNGGPEHLGNVQSGFERLTQARLADAAFFIGRDQQKRLEDFREDIKKLAFHAKLGSMYEKSERLVRLCEAVVQGPLKLELNLAALKRAACLAKADLATEMVTEMTSLQGTMGGIYARRGGEEEAVAAAIAGQYRPRFSGDSIPQTAEGLALGIADRIDTLSAFFSVGAEPTGSADPFGLRREALSVLACLTGSKTHVSLKAAVGLALEGFRHQVAPQTAERLLDFLEKRFEVSLREQGFRHDVVRAVLAVGSDDPFAAEQRVAELQALASAQDGSGEQPFKTAVQAYLRCRNIVDSALSKKMEIAPAHDGSLFEADEERALAGALAALPSGRDLEGQPGALGAVMQRLHGIAPAINAFFDKVLVMAEDPRLRANRLALAQAVVALLLPYADLRKLEGFR
jgi:tetrameric-type glycyl-tRNA synthetase beta subunit